MLLYNNMLNLINTNRKFATRLLILVANHIIIWIFATGVIDTGGELAVPTSINDTDGKWWQQYQIAYTF